MTAGAEVRVRFAPSPTGLLHLGNARTALFNWLFARGSGGRFVLRIEDTDPERSRPEFETAILEDVRWLGLDWDEGPDVGGGAAPYRQSEALGLYRGAAEELVRTQRAYHCVCAPAALEADRRRQEARGEAPRYSGRCRDLGGGGSAPRTAGGPAAIRFRMPEEEIAVADLIKGEVRFHGGDLDDFVLLRSDGSASYHLAVVVDDRRMAITHVIRGEDHLPNTPRQIALARALGHDSPRFAHLPLLVGRDGAPLSKRQGDHTVRGLRDGGVLPEAIVNHLALLGWSPPDDVAEVMGLAELAERFSLDRVSGAPARFDRERLSWFERQHLRRLPLDRLLAPLGLPGDDERVRRAVSSLREEAETLGVLGQRVSGILEEPAVDRLPLGPVERRALEAVSDGLASAVLDTPSGALRWLDAASRDLPVPKRELMRAVRRALIGADEGPPVATLLWILGPAGARRRLARALGPPVART